MRIESDSPEEYISKLPENRQVAISRLRKVILDNLPKGFSEEMSYGFIGYVVPHSIYSAGYHCDPKLPLPFLSIASQKNFVAIYHMGIYAFPELLNWFTEEYPSYVKTKLDMGKSCIRFKNPEKIPFDLIGGLVAKMTVAQWVEIYETNVKR